MKSKSLQRKNEKDILLRMAQSLQNGIKAQQKGMTDVGPYAKQYNILRERIVNILGKDSETFTPELSENLVKYGWSGNSATRVRYFDEITVAINQMVSFLEMNVRDSLRILTNLEDFVYNNLRKSMIEKPTEEKDVCDIIDVMLTCRGYVFKREKILIPYSSKSFKPDFTFDDLSACLEVKLCKTGEKEKELVDEINADIPAYTTKFENVTFLVYDLGVIRDIESFRKDIEMNNPRIKVIIVKH